MKAQKLSSNIPSIAVIGGGYWGKNLVRNISQLGALKLISDKDEDALIRFNEQYPDVNITQTVDDVIARKDIDAVVISTPAETHYYIAREALLSGKHVFVEKPLALQVEEATDLIAIAKEQNQILMVGHLLQYHPVFIRLKEMVENGELGKINYIYSHRLNLGKIRREENILWSFAPHDISMILSLAGELPESIQATGGYYLQKKIADVTTTHFEFPSGLVAQIFVSWLHPFKEQKLVVVGSKKMAVFDDTKDWKYKLLVYPHEIKWEKNIPTPHKAEPEFQEIEEKEPLRTECQHFIECIINNNQPKTDGEEGINVLKVLNASQLSLDQSGKKKYLAGAENGESKTSSNINSEYFAHENAVIDADVSIGSGTKIWHFSHILSGSKIGEKCNIGQNVVVGPDVVIGNGCKIQNNVSIYKGVTLEDGVFCGPSMVFTNVCNPRAEIRKMNQLRPTLVKKGSTIGANATIICGVTIGRYAFIGAGAVVSKSVPDYALVVGNPAKRIGWMCKCGERLSEQLECLSCKKKYEDNKGHIVEII